MRDLISRMLDIHSVNICATELTILSSNFSSYLDTSKDDSSVTHNVLNTHAVFWIKIFLMSCPSKLSDLSVCPRKQVFFLSVFKCVYCSSVIFWNFELGNYCKIKLYLKKKKVLY